MKWVKKSVLKTLIVVELDLPQSPSRVGVRSLSWRRLLWPIVGRWVSLNFDVLCQDEENSNCPPFNAQKLSDALHLRKLSTAKPATSFLQGLKPICTAIHARGLIAPASYKAQAWKPFRRQPPHIRNTTLAAAGGAAAVLAFVAGAVGDHEHAALGAGGRALMLVARLGGSHGDGRRGTHGLHPC